MKVLVTGSTGMLGKDICEILNNRQHEVYGVSRDSGSQNNNTNNFLGDLTDLSFIQKILDECQPEVIIHCAAIVNVDYCESDRDLAENVHVNATSMLASYNPGKARFIYISTDSVFDGDEGNYTEEDTPHPINYYALTKLRGEIVALAKNRNSVVLRTNIFGFHNPPGKSLAEWAISNLFSNKTISGFNDVYFNPVYTKQLALVIADHFVNSHQRGIWNITSEGYVSKYEFLVKLARASNLPESLIIPNSMSSVNFTAPRPKNTFLNIQKMKSNLGIVLDLEAGLEEFKVDYSKFIEAGISKH